MTWVEHSGRHINPRSTFVHSPPSCLYLRSSQPADQSLEHHAQPTGDQGGEVRIRSFCNFTLTNPCTSREFEGGGTFTSLEKNRKRYTASSKCYLSPR